MSQTTIILKKEGKGRAMKRLTSAELSKRFEAIELDAILEKQRKITSDEETGRETEKQ